MEKHLGHGLLLVTELVGRYWSTGPNSQMELMEGVSKTCSVLNIKMIYCTECRILVAVEHKNENPIS